MNNLNENKFPDRKLNRHKEYDYSQNGSYFITICTDSKKSVLTKIIEDDLNNCVYLSDIGKEVVNSLNYLNSYYDDLIIEEYVIMPNHIHLLLTINYDDKKISVEKIIYQLKSFTTHKYGKKLWQRSYYDHIIQNEKDFLEKQKYIQDNPAKWRTDEYYYYFRTGTETCPYAIDEDRVESYEQYF